MRAADRLAALVRIPTISPPAGPLGPDDAEVFAAFRTALRDLYPRAFSAATVEDVGRAGLLLRVAGAESDRPVVLMAHQDVVPVPADWRAEGWEHPPFDGVIAHGRVHGRGTLDDKGSLVAILEAVEDLVASGWRPARDLYLLFGADEESYGDSAIAATALLEERGVEPWLVLDEGGAIASEAFPGVTVPMAVVGPAEKGVLTVRLRVESAGGHASTPPRRSAPVRIAQALVELEEHPFPAALHDVSVEMFEAVAPHASGPLRPVLRRARDLRGALTALLPRLGPEMAAMVRTTAAVTRLQGSTADNVLATEASAVLNIRIAVGSSVAEVMARLRDVIDDGQVQLEILEQSEPSPVSPTGDDPRWQAIRAAVARACPEAVTVPYLTMAATDGRHVARIAPAVYRFSPLRMDAAQRAAIHGPNEQVEIAALGEAVDFYRALLTGAALGPADPAGDDD